MREIITKELETLAQEISRAEQDGTSRLPLLEGWQQALEWVAKQLPEEG